MDNFRRVTSDQLKERLRKGDPGLLVDLRKQADFEQGHIAGSVNVPLEDLAPDQFLRDYSERPVYLICSSGKRAYQAAELFYQSGFHDVIIMAAGILSWRVHGFPLVSKSNLELS